MTQQEFFQRTGVQVSQLEFDAINNVYYASDFDKDEFCKFWCRMNASRVKEAREQRKHENKVRRITERAWEIIRKLENQAKDAEDWSLYPDLTISEKKFLSETWGFEVYTDISSLVCDLKRILKK